MPALTRPEVINQDPEGCWRSQKWTRFTAKGLILLCALPFTGSCCTGSRENIQAGSNATGISKNQGDPYLTAARELGELNHK